MKPLITPLLLASSGINVPDDQVVPLLDYMNDLLEERIGEAVAESLDDTQLEELATLQETATDKEIRTWIEAHVTSLPELIQDEVAVMLGEAAQHRTEFSKQ